MKVQSSENKLVMTEEFIFDQNKLPSDPNNHFKSKTVKIYSVVQSVKLLLALSISNVHKIGVHLGPYIFNVGTINKYVLKAIKNATGTGVIFPINISLIHFVFVQTSVPNVGECFTKTWAQLHTSAKNFGEKWQIHQIFGNHIKSWNFIQFQRANNAFHSNKQKNGLQHKIHFAGRT